MTEQISSSDNLHQLKILSGDKLPPPEVLEEYERIMPGVTKILLDTADQNLQRKYEIEKRRLSSNNLKSFAGLIFGFLIGMFGLGGGFYLTLHGYNVIGALCTSSTLVTLVMAFIYGSQGKRNGNSNKESLINKL